MATTPSDLGTPELAKRHALKAELTGKGYAVRMRVVDGCVIDKLLGGGKITDLEHSTCVAFLRDLHSARLLGVSVCRYEPTTPSQSVPQRVALAMRKVNEAIRRLDRDAGAGARKVFLAALLNDVAPGTDERMDAFQRALHALESFYEEWRGSPRRPSLAETIAKLEV